MADYSIAPDFDVKADYLRKASLFMSSEKTRYYLKGVCLEPHPVKGAYLVATDGHRAGIFYDEAAIVPERVILTVPKEMATKLKRSLTGHEDNKHARVLIHKSAGSGVLVHFGGKLEGEVMVANLIDGTFPDWHRILPKNSTLREPCHPVAFNAGYMADLAECGMSGQKTPANVQIMTSEGANSPFCVRTNCPDFLGVMMPVRNKDRDSSEALPPLKWLVGKA